MSKSPTHHRSAVTGRYVTEKYGKSHPKTTVQERIKSPVPKQSAKR